MRRHNFRRGFRRSGDPAPASAHASTYEKAQVIHNKVTSLNFLNIVIARFTLHSIEVYISSSISLDSYPNVVQLIEFDGL